jgi:hypothetical protein
MGRLGRRFQRTTSGYKKKMRWQEHFQRTTREAYT